MDNKKIIIVVIIFSLVLLSVIGTYAYFSTNVSSSGGALNARTAKFSISLDVSNGSHVLTIHKRLATLCT